MGFGEIVSIVKLSALRFFTKRPYGIAYFKIDKFLFSKIVRFDKESVKTANGLWTFEKDKIYVDKDAVKEVKKAVLAETPTDEEVIEAVKSGKTKELLQRARSEYKQTEFMGWRAGYPVIFLDQNDMRPLTFEKQLGEPVNPRNIQSVLNKEISAFEAELMRKQRDKLEKLLLLTLVFTGIAVVLLWMQGNDIGIIKEAVLKIPTQTQGLNG